MEPKIYILASDMTEVTEIFQRIPMLSAPKSCEYRWKSVKRLEYEETEKLRQDIYNDSFYNKVLTERGCGTQLVNPSQ